MPCFLAGVSAAEAFALARGIPLVRTTHQQGHAAAALFAAKVKSSSARKHCCSIFPAARLTCSFAMK